MFLIAILLISIISFMYVATIVYLIVTTHNIIGERTPRKNKHRWHYIIAYALIWGISLLVGILAAITRGTLTWVALSVCLVSVISSMFGSAYIISGVIDTAYEQNTILKYLSEKSTDALVSTSFIAVLSCVLGFMWFMLIV